MQHQDFVCPGVLRMGNTGGYRAIQSFATLRLGQDLDTTTAQQCGQFAIRGNHQDMGNGGSSAHCLQHILQHGQGQLAPFSRRKYTSQALFGVFQRLDRDEQPHGHQPATRERISRASCLRSSRVVMMVLVTTTEIPMSAMAWRLERSAESSTKWVAKPR